MISDKKHHYQGCLLVLLVIMLLGCESSEDHILTNYINEVKARKPKPIEPISENVPLVKFIYPEHDNRRNPFKQKKIIKADNDVPNKNRHKEPLEHVSLNVLKFVGILKQGSLIWGLVSQPNGEIVRVQRGHYMGENFGKIISLTNTSLTLEEMVQVSGKWEKKITVFNLNGSN